MSENKPTPTPTPQPSASAPSGTPSSARVSAPLSSAPAPKRQARPSPTKQPEPRIEIINMRANPVRVMYVPEGQSQTTTLLVPTAGLRHGDYPPEVLDAPHFKDLIDPKTAALQTRPQRE